MKKLTEIKQNSNKFINPKMDDIKFVRRLMKENSEALGFIPLSALEKAYDESRLLVYSENNERIGYLLFGPIKNGKDVTIWQICVNEKKRKMGFGKKLFNQFHKLAIETGAKGIRLRCADDLPANYFWKSLSFKLISTISSKSRRRKLNIYYLTLA